MRVPSFLCGVLLSTFCALALAENVRADDSQISRVVLGDNEESSMELDGKLFVYSPPTLSAFVSGPAGEPESRRRSSRRRSRSRSRRRNSNSNNDNDSKDEENFAIYVPGLTEGIMGTDYLPQLSETLASMRPPWNLVQPVLSSSYLGYGVSSLEKDAEEIETLIASLSARYPSLKRIILIGYSTGCQDMVTLLTARVANSSPKVEAVILQAPVSDRLAYETFEFPKLEEYQALAQELIDAGKGSELLPRDADPAPITASRFISFTTRLGDDDLFSFDLTDAELMERATDPLGKGVKQGRVLIVFARDDEFVPERVDQEALGERLVSLIDEASGCPGSARSVVVPGNHALSAPNGARFVEEIKNQLETWGL